jgi:glycerol-3-phosphate dehydrogenase
MSIPDHYDLLVVGGGINGAGVARDAAGRGLSVLLIEQYDLAAATSMASSKLIHGGLRYLEQGRIRLVREALAEREVLLRMAPHLVRPLAFALPIDGAQRPAWQIRTGLWLYDHVAGRSSLPRSGRAQLNADSGLHARFRSAFTYSDAWGDDARLVVANARGAADLGALVRTHTRCTNLQPGGSGWIVQLQSNDGGSSVVHGRAVVNATGPWVSRFLGECGVAEPRGHARLVKGGHIVLKRRLPGERAYLLQHPDGRVVFVIPYEDEFTLVGTTDVPVSDGPGLAEISTEEIEYLRDVFERYFAVPFRDDEIAWTFAGIRALHDDGSSDPTRVSRDYVLDVHHAQNGAPLLSVYGGKLTTYRPLAEHVMARLRGRLPEMGPAWTSRVPVPGGDIADGDLDGLIDDLCKRYPELPTTWIRALARRHGSLAASILGSVRTPADLGQHFGGGLTAREVDYLVDKEWAVSADDILWRRTKAGLHVAATARADLEAYLTARRSGP